MKKRIILAGTVFLLFLVSCNFKSKENKTQEEKTGKSEVTVKKKKVYWNHKKGENGPENWKNLCAAFADCGGKVQSPVDIELKKVKPCKDLKKLEFDYKKSKVHISNNGHTVQFNITGNNTLKIKDKVYKLLQFHYHAMSEHTINGKHFPLEVHFVHKYSNTDFAVVGVMFVKGKENALFKKYLDKFPTEKGKYASDETLDLASLLPKIKSYYNYNGSLTTPPCSEVVSWYVLSKPIEASKQQLEKFAEILHSNFRPVQPLNGRKIKVYKK